MADFLEADFILHIYSELRPRKSEKVTAKPAHGVGVLFVGGGAVVTEPGPALLVGGGAAEAGGSELNVPGPPLDGGVTCPGGGAAGGEVEPGGGE